MVDNFPRPENIVRLFDATGTKIAEFDHFVSYESTKRVNSVGSYRFVIDGHDNKVSLFIPDHFIELWRRDVPSGITVWYKEDEWIFKMVDDGVSSNSEMTFSAGGVGFLDMLQARIIGYKAGTIRAVKDTVAETAMKEYVIENAGKLATLAYGRVDSNGEEFNGVTQGLQVANDQGRGGVWQGDRAFENLMDVITDIADTLSIDFNIYGIGPAQFEFEVYPDQLGEDRTNVGVNSGSGMNASGNPPVVFDLSMGNVQDIQYTLDHVSEANAIMVLGQGDMSTRYIYKRENADAISRSNLARREISRGSNQEFQYQHQQYGDEQLKSMAYKETVTFNPALIPSTVYGRDYFLGDKITVNYRGVIYHKRIIEVKKNISGSEEKITLEFTDVP
jgi:hypothetical protein